MTPRRRNGYAIARAAIARARKVHVQVHENFHYFNTSLYVPVTKEGARKLVAECQESGSPAPSANEYGEPGHIYLAGGSIGDSQDAWADEEDAQS